MSLTIEWEQFLENKKGPAVSGKPLSINGGPDDNILNHFWRRCRMKKSI